MGYVRNIHIKRNKIEDGVADKGARGRLGDRGEGGMKLVAHEDLDLGERLARRRRVRRATFCAAVGGGGVASRQLNKAPKGRD
tara:strand:+ start:113 stop:361 length:249 start_codon:yes stop_codon:yes gene_type:complete